MDIKERNRLFEAQRHFLEKMFDHRGLRNRRVTVPDDNGKPIVFEFEVNLDEGRPFATIISITEGDWGSFEVKDASYGDSEDGNMRWLKVSLMVDLRGEE